MLSRTKRDSITPVRLFKYFEEGSGEYSQPLLTKSPNETHAPPPLLPGETLILQQDNVTCVGSLSSVANGVLHLTNYRIIFAGSFILDIGTESTNIIDAEDVARRGYRYQKRKDKFINPGHLKKFIGRSFKKDSKPNFLPTTFKWKSKVDLQRKYNLDTDTSLLDNGTSHIDLVHVKPLVGSKMLESDASYQVCVSLPCLSIYDIHKFPKQYLSKEKLMMLRDGLEVITSNFLSVRFCLGATGSYDADEMILRLKQSKSKNLRTVFAYTYGKEVSVPKSCEIVHDRSAQNFYRFADEFERQGFDFECQWSAFCQSFCLSYPTLVVVPTRVAEADDFQKLAEFYNNNCFPVVTWRSHQHGNVLLRSGTTKSQRGLTDNRCEIDELLMSALDQITDRNDKIFIYSDRENPLPPKTNTVRGLSLHEGETFYYPNCTMFYFDFLPDILSVQRSAMKLLDALSYKCDDSRYLSLVEESGWLEQIQLLLDTAKSVALGIAVDEANVLVALDEGTDRAAQVSSLAQLMLDPYYRTFDGFQVLIQKEWIHFKHPFVRRNLSYFSDSDDQSPIFLQFLDCVWQLTQQFPTSFQFGDQFLEVLAEHAYSGRFGTFLEVNDSPEDGSISFWSWVNIASMTNSDLYNYNYAENENVGPLYPIPNIPWLNVWSWFNRLKREPHLQEAAVFGVMQLEKLQSLYRLTQQFPTSFQFGDQFLEVLAEHAYSGRFGTFLEVNDSPEDGSISFWSWVNIASMTNSDLYNYNYAENENVGPLYPIPNIPWLNVWSWFNRLKREPHLQEAAVFGVMQLEKLQSLYRDEYKRYDRLLHRLSEVDANSPVDCAPPINSRAVTHFHFQPKLLPRRPSWGSYPDSLSTLTSEEDCVPAQAKWMKNRAKSLDNITSIAASRSKRKSSYYPKVGKSRFFVQKGSKEKCRHLSLPAEWHSSAKITNLEDYLNDEGISNDIVEGVHVSKSTCCGYLTKRGNVHKSWQKRWFVLDITKRYAAYFESPTSVHPKGVISFRQICDVYPHMKQHKYPNLFIVDTVQRKYYIKTPCAALMRIWVCCFSLPVSSLSTLTDTDDSPASQRKQFDESLEISRKDSLDNNIQ